MKPQAAYITLEQYLEAEERTELRHEYIDGRVYRMSGASRRHHLLVTNLIKLAATAAERRPHCQVFANGMKLHIPAHNCVYYPDIAVVCDPNDKDERLMNGPCAIIEILSPSTSSIDRREKRLSYRTIPALREYIILDQNRTCAEFERREPTGWRTQWLDSPDDTIEISCLDLTLTLQDIYRGIELPSGIADEGEEYEDEANLIETSHTTVSIPTA